MAYKRARRKIVKKPMKKASKKKEVKKPLLHPEAQGLVYLGFSLFFFLSLFSFEVHAIEKNWLGLIGHTLGYGATLLFGLGSYALVAYGLILSGHLILHRPPPRLHLFHFSLFIASTCILLNIFAEHYPNILIPLQDKVFTEKVLLEKPVFQTSLRYYLGGTPLYILYKDLPIFPLKRIFSDVGLMIIFSFSTLISVLLFFQIRLTELVKKTFYSILAFNRNLKKVWDSFRKLFKKVDWKQARESFEKKALKPKVQILKTPPVQKEEKVESNKGITIRTLKTLLPTKMKPAPLPKKTMADLKTTHTHYQPPSPDLLANPRKIDQPALQKDLEYQAEVLEATLKNFGIDGKVSEINCGPTITSFEVQPPIGVKVQKIKALESDIALSLQAKSIRILAPIPGKAAVGVEIPALHPQEVSFKEMLYHYQQRNKKFQVPILLGKTVNGDNVMADLAKMPHLLIAGATGSGKSVCVNTIVMSILMTASPDDIKLMMIDPKKVELTQYSRLPHMIAPVISEAHGAYAALQWLVREMQFRYDILKQLGLRNITAFNNRKANKEYETSLEIEIPDRMPIIVGIIDEFADLMMVSSSDLETPIARIAQMARAVGIHLILATQRPSREVITGIIKANFPCRIAFKVSSRINSQIVLDENGAESLLGNGDLLFLPPGSSQLVRAQGAFISDDDINQCVQKICEHTPPNYLIKSFDAMPKEDALGSKEGKDDLYESAFQIVTQTKNASTTFLQRKLKIGYARAASLIDELEENGVISPPDGSRARRVLK